MTRLSSRKDGRGNLVRRPMPPHMRSCKRHSKERLQATAAKWPYVYSCGNAAFAAALPDHAFGASNEAHLTRNLTHISQIEDAILW